MLPALGNQNMFFVIGSICTLFHLLSVPSVLNGIVGKIDYQNSECHPSRFQSLYDQVSLYMQIHTCKRFMSRLRNHPIYKFSCKNLQAHPNPNFTQTKHKHSQNYNKFLMAFIVVCCSVESRSITQVQLRQKVLHH